jgi:RNA polymerase sigma-70 factor (ECF subfamily)
MNDPFGKERDLVGPDPEPPRLDSRGEAFFRDHLETFRRIAAYRLRNHHDAQDAVMDTMVTMHRKIERILAAANPIGLALKMLDDAIIDYYRRSVKITDREHLVPEMPPIAHLTELRRYEPLDRAMEELEVVAPMQAQCVRLHDLMELPYAQVAAIAGISENAAKTNVSRGRKHLNELMLTERSEEKGDS